jgi:DNA-binding XRE family transcriptional regulator
MNALPVTYDFKTLRKSRGYTQVGLSVALGASPQTINKIELYGYVPQYALRKRICKMLGVEMHELWPDLDD